MPALELQPIVETASALCTLWRDTGIRNAVSWDSLAALCAVAVSMPEVVEKRDLQDSEYRLPVHWLLRRAGLVHYIRKTDLMATMIQEAGFTGGRVLSIGCGDGRGLFELSQRLGPIARYEGVDFSERAIAFARLMAPGLTFTVQDGVALQYPSGSITLAMAREVIEHVPPDDLPAFVREAHRVLKPGGLFLVTTPSILRRVPDKHFQHFSVEKLRDVLEEGGFSVVQMRGFGWWPAPRFERLYRFVIGLPTLWRIRVRLGTHEMPLHRADDLLAIGRKR